MTQRCLLVVAVLALGTSACDVPSGEGRARAPWPPEPMADAGIMTEIDVSVPAEPEVERADESAAVVAATNVAQPISAVSRPAMDMDATGPMIHTRPVRTTDVADESRFDGARFARPEHVRGLYINAWAAGSSERMDELIRVARETEVNAFVLDIKDATGFLSHDTKVPTALDIGADGQRRIRDLPALLDRLEAEGIYPIARIVVVKDPLLIQARPELAIQDTAGGVWVDSKEIIWLNPYQRGVWDYHLELAREVAELGFPEIQWDYIRFPDAPADDMARARFPGGDGIERAHAIRGFLAHAEQGLADLPVRSTADVFGVTTSFTRDVGIGQLWEEFIDVVDVALPMIYPSHYWPHSFGYEEPNARPYEIVYAALDAALDRSAAVEGAGITRPWLQDFTLGPPTYGGPEVRAQIQAVYDVGLTEWVLWNPSSKYSVSALEPAHGFEVDPLIRVAGTLAPTSRRFVVMDSIASLPAPPQWLVGEFEDDYGIRYSISKNSWVQGNETEYRVAQWDPERREVLVRSSGDGEDAGAWARIDWVELEDDGSGFTWAFCYSAFDGDSEAAARAAPSADRIRPASGCGGYPFSRMRSLAADGS
ncbi:MAG: putative glycoside hydrolase [Gemmatimonadota bacterium]